LSDVTDVFKGRRTSSLGCVRVVRVVGQDLLVEETQPMFEFFSTLHRRFSWRGPDEVAIPANRDRGGSVSLFG